MEVKALNNPISSISYTNKDFNSIFTELLELTKQLSDKWDPTISNESDPGVVLLKTDAIIGDKNNYNIDKNILEAFPETVTQEINARNLYKQLAYYMPWYKSSITPITISYVGEELTSSDEIKIPIYTMVSNTDSSHVYTLMEDIIFNKENPVVSVNAIEGVINDLKINGSDVITLENLDTQNRVYFEDYTVAENGIFISNIDSTDRTPWKKVDNLLIETLGTKCFEFGVDSRTETCYLEFPKDIANLLEAGIKIKYIVSNGASGNISARVLERFYQEESVDFRGQPLPLNSDTFIITNPSASVSGSDPETISDAYLSYKKTAGTFNTLVTVRDYVNAIYNSGFVSNAIVSDRTNDLQTSYIVATDDEVNPEYIYHNTTSESIYDNFLESLNEELQEPGELTIEQIKSLLQKYDTETILSDEIMSPFDLKLYLLHNSGTIANIQQYEDTFSMEPIEESTASQKIMSYLSSQKCIQHDYKKLLADKACMYQNAFPIDIKIVPTTKLTEAQVSEVKVNIIKSLYNVTCSRAQEFGIEPNYDLIYDTIQNADSRIKTVILDDFKYITFALYWDTKTKGFKQIPVNIQEFSNTKLIKTFSNGDELVAYHKIDNKAYWNITKRNNAYFVYVPPKGKYNQIEIQNLEGSQPIPGIGNEGLIVNPYDIVKIDPKTNNFEVYSKLLLGIQKNILLKSILAGRTPLFIPTSPFKYSMSDNEILDTEAEKVSTALMISPYTTSSAVIVEEVNDVDVIVPTLPNTVVQGATTYKLKENENIRLLAPSFITKRSFSNYTKFILRLNAENSLTQRVSVDSYTKLEAGVEYEMSKTDWAVVANNIITIYSSLAQIEDSGESHMNAWASSFEQFVGKSIDNFYDDGKSVLVEDYNTNSSWKESANNPLMVTGEIKTDLNISSGVPYKEISQYDPVYQTLRSRTPLNSIDLYQTITTYAIPAETDYQLKEGESITFFWREEDGDDIPYRYEKYTGISKSSETSIKKSPIIKANFTMQGESFSDAWFIDTLNDKGQILNGEEGWSQVKDLYGDNDLSGTKSIDIREMNQVILDRLEGYYKQQNRIYFITNTKENDGDVEKYQLILNKTSEYTNSSNTKIYSYRHTLEDNEFFIYTSQDGSAYEVLSAGTLIGIDTEDESDNITLKVQALDESLVLSGGVDSFYDKSISIPQEYTVFCREQQIYSIVGGDELHLNLENREEFWKYNSGSQLNKLYEGKGPSESDEDYLNRKSMAVPYFCSWKDTYVKGFSLSYTSNNTEISLPKLDIENDNDCIWVGRSFLNLKCSTEEPQSIIGLEQITKNEARRSCQNIIVDNTSYPTYNNTSGEETSEVSVQLRTSIPIDKVGGKGIDISYLDSLGNRTASNLYLYQSNAQFDAYPFYLKDNGEVEVYMNNESIEILVNYKENTPYIFSIFNPSDEIGFKLQQSINTNSNSTTYTPVMNLSLSSEDYLYRGRYYFLLDSKALGLKFEFSDTSTIDKLTISTIMKSELNPLITKMYDYLFINPETREFDINVCYKGLKELDYDGIFKYDFQPDDELYIEDPLLSNTFFNSQHICNNYTIPRCTLRISDASDSKITVVNNR